MSLPRPRLVGQALHAAAPLLAGQAVALGSTFGLWCALVGWCFAGNPAGYAHYYLLGRVLQWVLVGGTFGLPTGLLRLLPERPERRDDLLVTTWAAVGAFSVAVTAAIAFVPGLGSLLMGDPVAEQGFLVFGWKAPYLALLAVAVAAAHAEGRLRRKAVLDASERVLAVTLTMGGWLLAGWEGLLAGSLGSSALAALAGLLAERVRDPLAARPRADLFRDVFRIGRVQVAYFLVETFRDVLVLRVMNHWLPRRETGLLGAAMGFALPFVTVAEMLAQALYPKMVGPRGESPDLDRTHRRMLVELAAVGLPLLAVAGAAAALVFPWIGDGKYAGAVVPALALLPGAAAQGMVAHTGYVLLVRHRLPRAVLASLAALATAGGLAWLLVPRWGAVGGAAALSAALVLRAVLLVLAARTRP